MKGFKAQPGPLTEQRIEWTPKESWLAAYRPLPFTGGREPGGQQPELEGKGLLQSGPQRLASSTKLSRLPATNHVFLGSWMVDICQEGRSLRLAPPEETHSTPEEVLLQCTQETKWPRWGRQLRHMIHLGQCTCQTPIAWAAQTWEGHKTHTQPGLCPCRVSKNMSGLDLGSAWNAGPALDSSPAEHAGVWAV